MFVSETSNKINLIILEIIEIQMTVFELTTDRQFLRTVTNQK